MSESVLCETPAALQEKPQSILQKPACYFLTRTDPVLRSISTPFNSQSQPLSTLIFVLCISDFVVCI